MPLTPLTEDARASAREKAVLARAHRQEIKRALSDRELSVRQVLDMVDSDPALAKMPVGQMLRALPGIGAVRAERIIEELHNCTYSPPWRPGCTPASQDGGVLQP